MAAEEPIRIEVVYALPDAQHVVELIVPAGTTVMQAIAQSGLLPRYPSLDLPASKMGIYGRIVTGQTVLADGDRIEIYRPLLVDPKQARRKRAARPR